MGFPARAPPILPQPSAAGAFSFTPDWEEA